MRVAAFLATHPRVSEVFHPSRPDHPDAAVIARDYRRHGSLLSFRVAGADEGATRHVADVIAMTTVVRYALSFDGLATKVNHHTTVSEYFTPLPDLRRSGFDRLIRLGIGLEDADDLIAALNWALHHAGDLSPDAVAAWQQARAASLGVG
jgi:cystathionine beta-lyase/cystathionine gamma-synthase